MLRKEFRDERKELKEERWDVVKDERKEKGDFFLRGVDSGECKWFSEWVWNFIMIFYMKGYIFVMSLGWYCCGRE